jgi:hypothetical protein
VGRHVHRVGLLAYFTAHRASKVARWLTVGFLGISVLSFIWATLRHRFKFGPFSIAVWACEAMLIACVWLLFTPASNKWFAGPYTARNVHSVFE